MTRTLFGAVIAAFLLTLASATAVAAHAELEETNPPDGGTISTPFTVTGRFSEPLVGNSNVVVRNSAGDSVAQGEVAPDDPAVLVAELPEVPPGEYRARWTASTADGHTERFTTTFLVVAATPPPSPTPVPSAVPSAATPGATPGATPVATPSPSPPPAPTPSPTPSDGGSTASGGDVLLALVIAAAAFLVLGIYLFTRQRH